MTSHTNELLAERGTTHGNYADHARITQRLKKVIYDELIRRDRRGQEPLSDEALEALDMEMHKTGRIIAGKWDFADHWLDKAGYATLVANSIQKSQKTG